MLEKHRLMGNIKIVVAALSCLPPAHRGAGTARIADGVRAVGKERAGNHHLTGVGLVVVSMMHRQAAPLAG